MDHLLITTPPGRWCQLQYPSYQAESKHCCMASHRRPSLSPSLLSHGTRFCLLVQHWWSVQNWCFNSCWQSFLSLSCSLAMFYVIALAGAHKRVINQLREQLVMVGWLQSVLRSTKYLFLIRYRPCLIIVCVITKMGIYYLQEGRDKRFLIQKLCQAQKYSAIKSPGSRSQPRSSSRSSPSYHTSFANNFTESMFLAHPTPDSSTHVWG